MSVVVPKHWEAESLGKVVQFLDNKRIPIKESDREKRHGSYPYYGANGQIDWIDDFIFDEPVVLLAEDGGFFGSKEHPIAFKVEGKFWVNNHAHVLRPIPGIIDINYLHWFLSFLDVSPYLSGSTRPKLTKTDASRIVVTFPKSIELQSKIGSIISRTDKVLRTGIEANKVMKNIAVSIFLNKFGKSRPNIKIEHIAKFISSGSTPLGGQKTYLSEGIQFIRSQNVLMNELSLEDVAYISREVHERMKRTWLKDGDILLNITGASLGRVAVFRGPDDLCNVNQHVCIIRIDQERAIPEYVSHYISSKSGQAQIWTIQSGASRQALNFNQVRSLDLFLPDVDEQLRFLNSVKKIQILKQKQNKSSGDLKQLFWSILLCAFKGELLS